jgi:hypothetical protein
MSKKPPTRLTSVMDPAELRACFLEGERLSDDLDEDRVREAIAGRGLRDKHLLDCLGKAGELPAAHRLHSLMAGAYLQSNAVFRQAAFAGASPVGPDSLPRPDGLPWPEDLPLLLDFGTPAWRRLAAGGRAVYITQAVPEPDRPGLLRLGPETGQAKALPLDEAWLDVACDPDGGCLYGITSKGAALEVRGPDGGLERRVDLAGEPWSMRSPWLIVHLDAPGGARLAVLDRQDPAVLVLDAEDLGPVRRIDLPAASMALDMAGRGGELLVPLWATDAVARVDVASGAVRYAADPQLFRPCMIDVDPASGEAWVLQLLYRLPSGADAAVLLYRYDEAMRCLGPRAFMTAQTGPAVQCLSRCGGAGLALADESILVHLATPEEP